MEQNSGDIKPLSNLAIALCFAGPALVMVFFYEYVFPRLVESGMDLFIAYVMALSLALACILLLSIAMYFVDGGQRSWHAFLQRFHLRRMGKNDWKWTVGLLVLLIPLSLLAVSLSSIVELDRIGIGNLNLGRRLEIEANQTTITLGLIPLLLGVLILNMTAEEFWFRGYVYPRQELAHRRHTWWIHGILWLFFHIYKWSGLIAIVPNSFLIPFLFYRTRNTTATWIMHFVMNGASILLLLATILVFG